VDVCDEKADQLFADFPNEWELIQEPKQPEETTPVERKKSGRK
jgi:hypothetical protein